MPSDFPLRGVMQSIQRKMIADFSDATAEIAHRGAKGREREALILKSYLDGYLPKSVRIVHGAEIVDAAGNRSAETDLVVVDPTTPPLYQGETFQLIPAEWAYGIIEVKSRLDTRELRDAQTKVARAKALEKSTYIPQTGDIRWTTTAYGSQFDYFPMYGMVFAYTSIELREIGAALIDSQREVPIDKWVDSVVVLDRGVLLYSDASGALADRPSPGGQLCAITSQEALVPATLAIQSAFTGAWMPRAKLAPYFGPEKWGGSIEVIGGT